MKATKLLLIALSCMLIVGCKKSQNEPEESQPQGTTTVITEDQLKSYFPYAVGDKIVFRNDDQFYDYTYTVKVYSFTNQAGKMNLIVSMKGSDSSSIDPEVLSIELKAEVTDNKILKIDFENSIKNMPKSIVTGTYTYDASKEDELLEKITLSNGAIIKEKKGLVYYEDYESGEWYFLKRK